MYVKSGDELAMCLRHTNPFKGPFSETTRVSQY